MLNVKLFLIALFSIAFLLNGCKNDDIVTPAQQKILSKIVQDSDNYSTFDYLNGKLIIFQTITSSEIFASVILDYNGSSLPQSEFYKTINEDLMKKYYFNASALLDSADLMRKDNQGNYVLVGHLKYSYNLSNRLSKMEQFNTNNQMLFTTEYTYDASGNVIEKHFYSSGGLNEIYTMTYDNKINPWNNLKGLLNYDATMSKNNLLSIIATYVNNSQNNYEVLFTYKYDSDGYPLSRVMEHTINNIKTTSNYLYEYQ